MRYNYFVVLFFILPLISFGQLSPGKLTAAHSKFEGISNCTLCHDLGSGVSSTKCLDCHKEINALIKKKKGYHSIEEVVSKECFSCHNEHHGIKFDMIHFDKDNFDHDLSQYSLDGKHAEIDCKKCHKPSFIKDSKLSKRPNTFLGLDQECLTCHDDFHKEQLSNNCTECHDFESFKPATYFDHDNSKFPLEGKHVNIDCKKCHKEEYNNNTKSIQFNGLKFGKCKNCHNDPHKNHFDNTCTQCHTVNGFDKFVGQKKFNHNKTNFTLKGKHQSVSCFSCHKKTEDVIAIFQDLIDIDEDNCINCHEDKHEGKFGQDCVSCHQESSFLDLKSIDNFNHSVTNYPLKGFHTQVECKECHQENYLTAIDYTRCKNCHEDYHNDEFNKEGQSPDCVQCHNVINGFEYSNYGFEDHQKSHFKLTGGHIATPCFACHLNEEKWTFKNIGFDCVDCHEDIHKSFIDTSFYPKQTCITCHVTDNWHINHFDHALTNFDLIGRHKNVSCASCHIEENGNNNFIQKFKNLSTNCYDCHNNIHGNQFEENGITDCSKCHQEENWTPSKFDHSKTKFPLIGKHAEIECIECHKPILKDSLVINKYKILKFECIDCHK